MLLRRPPGSLDEREADVGAAGVANESGKGEGELGHWLITQKDAIVVKQQKLRFISKALCQGLQLILN